MDFWQGLIDLGHGIVNITTPEGWGFTALGATCIGMMWYFNSAGHRMRLSNALDANSEQKRILDLSQQTIAEAFEFKHQKGEITDKDKQAMYALMFKTNPKMKEFRPEDKGVKDPVALRLFGMGATLRTRWPFQSKAERIANEARADHALFVNSINASKK